VKVDAPERLELLYDLSCAFGAQLDLDELIPMVVGRCREVLNAEGASLLLLDGRSNELYFPYVSERDPAVERQLVGLRFPADKGIAGEVLRNGKARHVRDASADGRFYDRIDAATGMRTRELLAVPLRSKHGPIGVLEVVNPLGARSFDADDLVFLEALAGSVAVALDNARMHAELKAREVRLRTQIGALRRDLARRDSFTEIIGVSEPMREVFRLMESAASTSIAVLIEGETGTGKELVARAIHRSSDRAEGPFVAVNIAALSGDLLESELFGHMRGAFTGAIKDRIGLFEAAHGGTILLDEIGDLPLAMQVKLLRVLQEGEVTPVGASEPRKVDVRVMSATNADLQAAAQAGRFRDDLYFRIAAFPLTLPPLRERREDLALLIDHFVARTAKRHGKRIAGIENAAFEVLAQHRWPGNVRELENEIERAAALTPDGNLVGVTALSARIRRAVAAAPVADAAARGGAPTWQSPFVATAPADEPNALGDAAARPTGDAHAVDGDHAHARAAHANQNSEHARPSGSDGRTDHAARRLKDARATFEAEYIRSELERNGGNVSRTARALGVSRVTLQKKLRELGLR
jgi:Nif-specific regulatory protein